MNIVIANTQEFNPQIGGVERVSSTLAREFEKLGHSVYFVAQKKSPYSQSYEPVVEQVLLPNDTIADCEDNVCCFTNFVANKKIDILMNQAGNILDFSLLCTKVKEQTKVRLISMVHTAPAFVIKVFNDRSPSYIKSRSTFTIKIRSFIKRIILMKLISIKREVSKLYRVVYQQSDFTVLLSEYYQPVFQKITGLKDISKLGTIVNPLSFVSEVQSVKYQKKKQLLYVGRLDYGNKRPDRLLKIWSFIYDKFPEWNLKFVGDGSLKPEMEELTRQLNLENVRFEGFTNPIDAYRESSIFCMTSTNEGLPMVLLEAMQFGAVPVAFNSFESIYDLIDDGVNGYIVNPFDLKLYAQCLETLIMDENRRMIMSQNARNSVIEKFDKNLISQKWISLFEEIIKN